MPLSAQIPLRLRRSRGPQPPHLPLPTWTFLSLLLIPSASSYPQASPMLRKTEVSVAHTLPPLPPQVASQVPNPMTSIQLIFLDLRTMLAFSVIFLGFPFLHPVHLS